MAKDRSLVRASDIGAWRFCQRAWWLANVKEIPHRNPAVLQRGDAAHLAHGRQVARSVRMARIGLFLMAAGVILTLIIVLIWLGSG